MKKIIITATLLISALGFSQVREKGTIELAPVLGVGFANLVVMPHLQINL